MNCTYLKHTDHLNTCKTLNQESVQDFFNRNIAKVTSLNERIIALTEDVNELLSKDNPIGS